MTTAKAIKKMIETTGPGRLWRHADFPDYSPHAVAQTLSRLSRAGFLKRVRKGIYYYPKQTVLGSSVPHPIEILKKTPQMSKKVTVGGVSAFYNLGLTSQVPADLVILCPSRSRSLQVGSQKVRIRARDQKLFRGGNEQEIWILEALRSIGQIPNCTSEEAIKKIIAYIHRQRLSRSYLLKLSLNQPPRVRALMGAVAMHLGYKGEDLAKVKATLNPLTNYKLGLAEVLPTSKNWNIL